MICFRILDSSKLLLQDLHTLLIFCLPDVDGFEFSILNYNGSISQKKFNRSALPQSGHTPGKAFDNFAQWEFFLHFDFESQTYILFLAFDLTLYFYKSQKNLTVGLYDSRVINKLKLNH